MKIEIFLRVCVFFKQWVCDNETTSGLETTTPIPTKSIEVAFPGGMAGSGDQEEVALLSKKNQKYVAFISRHGNVNVLDAHNLAEISRFKDVKLYQSYTAIVDGFFYYIDTSRGKIYNTPLINIVNNSSEIPWNHVITFLGEYYSMRGTGAVNGSLIYFTTHYALLRYDTASEQASKIQDIPRASYYSLIMVDGILYLHGDQGNFYSYDSISFKELPATDRSHAPGLFEVNGTVCCMNGDYADKGKSSVICYDPSQKTWSVIGKTEEARQAPGVATVSNRIFVIGGWNGNSDGTEADGMLLSPKVFDPLNGLWTDVVVPPSMKPDFYSVIPFIY